MTQGLVPQQQVDAQTAAVAQAEAAVESDRGAIDGAKLNLTYARITAPVSGRDGPAPGRPRQHGARVRRRRASSS